jgi:hypothetical protein
MSVPEKSPVKSMPEPGTSHQTPAPESSLPLSFDAWTGLSARMMSLDQDRRLDILDLAS